MRQVDNKRNLSGRANMRSLVKSTLFIVLLLVILTACSSEKDIAGTSSDPAPAENEVENNTVSASTETKEETKPFTGENFTFSYPSSWKDAGLNVPQVVAAFVNPNPKGGFVDNLNLIIEESSVTPEEAANLSAQGLSNGDGGELIQNYKKLNYVDVPEKAAGILEAEYTHGELNKQVVLTQYITESAMNSDDSIDSSATADSGLEGFTEENLFAEMMAYIIPTEIENGALDEKTYNYIIQHHKLFPALTPETQKSAKAEVDSTITSRHLLKNLNPYLDKMMEVSGYVVDITEEELDGGITIAEIHIIDDNDNSIVGFYANSTGDILEDDYVTLRGVPATYYSFDNISGGTTISILLGVSTLEKIE